MSEAMRVRQTLALIAAAAGSDRWVVGGSAGLLLRALPLSARPQDIDIYCDNGDAASIDRSLSVYAVDRQVVSETDMYRSTLSHYDVNGFRVELVGGFRVTAQNCVYETRVRELLVPFGDRAPFARYKGVLQHGFIAPLAHELWFNALRGREDRVRVIVEAMRGNPTAHLGALSAIEAGNGLSDNAKRKVRRWLEDQETGEPQWTLK